MMTFYSCCSILQDCLPEGFQISNFSHSASLISKSWLFITLIICKVACFSNVYWSFFPFLSWLPNVSWWFQYFFFKYELFLFLADILIA